jgi:DNA polymerase III subunit epsilon
MSHYRILVLDTECTGFSPVNSQIIELAAVTYSTQSKDVLFGCHFLLPTEGGNAAEHINNISPAALRERAVPGLVQAFRDMFADADCIVAHNASFDRSFVENQWPDLPERPWICSVKDLKFPRAGNASRKLGHLAVDHGINPTQAHRAMGDVNTLTMLLTRVPDLENQIRNAIAGRGQDGAAPERRDRTPKSLFEVVDSRFELNHLYRDAKFQWNKEKRRWEKRLSKGAESGFPFKVKPVELPRCFVAPEAPDAHAPVASPE